MTDNESLARALRAVRAETLKEAETEIEKWLEVFLRDRSTAYRDGKVDGASAALGIVQGLRGRLEVDK
jgi:hypothetical protein